MALNRPMPVSVDAYLADTQGLDACQHGAYLLAMFFQWKHGYLPGDEGELIRIMQLHGGNASSIASAVLKRFFRQQGDGSWINGKCDRVREHDATKALFFKERAQKAAAKRWQNHVAKRPSKCNASSIARSNAVLSTTTTLSPSQAQGNPPVPIRPASPSRQASHTAPLRRAAKRQSPHKPLARVQPTLPLQKALSVAPRAVAAAATGISCEPQDARFEAVAKELREPFWIGIHIDVENAGPCPWGNRVKKALSRMLEASPGLSVDQIRQCFKHRAVSIHAGEYSPSIDPARWLDLLPSFLAAPLNRYGSPMKQARSM